MRTIPAITAVLLGLSVTGALFAEEVDEISALNRLIYTRQIDLALEKAEQVANLDAWGEDGETPMTKAAQNFFPDNSYDVIHFLLELGANPHARNRVGATPLHYAARTGHLAIVHLLVERYGADPNSPHLAIDGTPREEHTPIAWAADMGHSRVVRFLEMRGAAFPVRLTNKLRAAVMEDAHQWRIYAEYRDIDYDDRPKFSYTRAHSRAKILTLRELKAPELLIEEAEEYLRIVEQMAEDPAFEHKRDYEIGAEARKAATKIMQDKPGYQEQASQWDKWLRGAH